MLKEINHESSEDELTSDDIMDIMIDDLIHTIDDDTPIPDDWEMKKKAQKLMWLMQTANDQGYLNLGDLIGIGSRRSFDDPPKPMFEEYIEIEHKKRVKRRQDLEAKGIHTNIGGV